MKHTLKHKKIAIVCDWISDWGGAELVLSQLMQIFPQADIFTSVVWQQENPVFEKYTVVSSTQHLSPTLSCQEREQATQLDRLQPSLWSSS